MAVSMRDLDPAFQGAGQKSGIEIWRIENFSPVPVLKSSYGKFFTGDSYIVLKTSGSKSGAFHHDIHYWLGKDTSQDEAGSAAVKTVELDAALGGRAVQYREVQGHETEKFLSYFKPCVIPQEGGIASGFKHPEAEKHIIRLYLCQGKHVVRVKEVPFARSSLNHDDVFILDTESKVFQFNGSNSSIQERAKALEVVQFIKETYHGGKCDIAAVEDGRLMADPETGEFWGWFGGFAPLPRKVLSENDMIVETPTWKLLSVEKGKTEHIQTDCLTRELLDTNKCYILYCTFELFIWTGRNTSLEERKSASTAAEELVRSSGHAKVHVIRVIEGFETVMFRCKFDSWPETTGVAVSEDGRGKVAALLKRQGVNVKGLLKTAPTKEEPEPHIDCTGNLQVWRVNSRRKMLLPASEQSKFYSGDCYIFQYSYPGEDKEECMMGTWFGKHSIEEERASARLLASTLIESLKFLPVRAHIYEGHEPIQFLSIFQSFIVYKGGLSEGYKDYIAKEGIADGTYTEDGVALFRVQGTGPDNMQAIQMDPVASSLNSSYCYIVHGRTSVFTWTGSLSTPEHQELVERMLDLIKPNVQCKPQKEGVESEQFWDLLGGKSEYASQKLGGDVDGDPHLFVCTSLTGDMKVAEIFNFCQDDLMAEDIYLLDCQSHIFVWVGQEVEQKNRMLALGVGEKFLERDFLLEKLSLETPIYVITEGNEPPFFTIFFKWDAAKSAMHGNSFQRKLMIVKNDGALALDKPKRRSPITYGGRSSMQDKSQRSRSVSFSPDRVRMRGRSPAFNALAANFENPNARNLSTPPPLVRKQLYPKSLTPDTAKLASRSAAIAALGSTFEKPPPAREPLSFKAFSPESAGRNSEDSVGSRIESLTIQEDVKGEAEDEENLPIYPYERLKTSSQDAVSDIDITKREAYLSTEEFQQNFGMAKESFYRLPKWRQNKLKMALQLF